jgi:hypothetical protein
VAVDLNKILEGGAAQLCVPEFRLGIALTGVYNLRMSAMGQCDIQYMRGRIKGADRAWRKCRDCCTLTH